MFKFDFDLDDEADIISNDEQLSPDEQTPNNKPTNVEIPLSQLVDALPAVISYSPLSISLSSRPEPLRLARRDLFDARFQLISEDRDLQFFETPSDLVPGVYEGGFKTWECCLDLVDYMESNELAIVGEKVLEVGCGTAVPSMYLLQKALSFLAKTNCPPETQLHLQDYNSSVLELVTLPNLLIAWYLSPTSALYLHNTERPDPSVPSEISITADLKSAFLSSLKQHNISLRFFSGPWEMFYPQKYDIILTSETIYRMASLPSLVHLLRTACLGIRADSRNSENDCMRNPSLCLVAAKVVYFGVGGGVAEFTKIVEGDENKEKRGRVETVWETKTGVKRRVLSVIWTALRYTGADS
ncbi:hypothetical protein APHAL10511_008158 [Amanita phalloides]|nr:hypothetical protein APHAL10511_008158 [Amanita phalloides]